MSGQLGDLTDKQQERLDRVSDIYMFVCLVMLVLQLS